MEKGRVGNKKKEKFVLCKRCKSKAVLVKIIGPQEIYKCTKCDRTTERWL